MDPYRLSLDLTAACAREDADALMERIQEALPPGVFLELGVLAPMDRRHVIPDSPLAEALGQTG